MPGWGSGWGAGGWGVGAPSTLIAFLLPAPPGLGWGQAPWGLGVWGGSISGFPTFRNLGFEIAGDHPGEAAFWVVDSLDDGGAYADWGPDPRQGEETFDLWFAYLPELDDASTLASAWIIKRDGAAPHSLTAPMESFESGWPGTDSYQSEVQNAEVALFGAVEHPGDEHEDEDFDVGWMTFAGDDKPFITILDDASTQAMPPESFDSGWGNDSFFAALDGPGSPATRPAFFNLGFVDEDFESVQFSAIGVPNPSTDTIFAPAHGYNDELHVLVEFGLGDPAGGIQNGHYYFVRSVDADNFSLSLTKGGTPIDIGTVGTAEMTIIPDPAIHWYTKLEL